MIIIKNQTAKTPRPGWALLKVGQQYRAHLGRGCADGVLYCAKDL